MHQETHSKIFFRNFHKKFNMLRGSNIKIRGVHSMKQSENAEKAKGNRPKPKPKGPRRIGTTGLIQEIKTLDPKVKNEG